MARPDNLAKAKRHSLALIAEIDEAELAVRMIEAGCRLKRPHPDPRVCLAHNDPEDQDIWQRAARAAMLYFQECVNAGKAPS